MLLLQEWLWEASTWQLLVPEGAAVACAIRGEHLHPGQPFLAPGQGQEVESSPTCRPRAGRLSQSKKNSY